MGKTFDGISAVIAAALIMYLTGCASGSGGDDSGIAAAPGVSSSAETSVNESSAEGAAKLTDDLTKLVYDAAGNTWATSDESCKKFVNIMKRECEKSPDIKGVYLLASDEGIIFAGGINSEEINGKKVDVYTTYEIGSVTKMFTATAV